MQVDVELYAKLEPEVCAIFTGELILRNVTQVHPI
jgi:hypothetical protein